MRNDQPARPQQPPAAPDRARASAGLYGEVVALPVNRSAPQRPSELRTFL